MNECLGCENNFYNGNNPYGVEKCWSLKDAKKIWRYGISTNAPMCHKNNYVKVKKLSCYHQKGYCLCSEESYKNNIRVR